MWVLYARTHLVCEPACRNGRGSRALVLTHMHMQRATGMAMRQSLRTAMPMRVRVRAGRLICPQVPLCGAVSFTGIWHCCASVFGETYSLASGLVLFVLGKKWRNRNGRLR
jgi:hypothetical protein